MTPGAEMFDLIDRLAERQAEVHKALGDRALDSLAIGKRLALRRKLEAGVMDTLTHVCVGPNLRHAVPVNARRRYTALPEKFLEQPLDGLPSRCVYLLLNNDIGQHLTAFAQLMQERPDCLFVVWDWDAQHWLQMSCSIAAQADIYVPAASENLYTISHFNPHMIGPVFVAANQWSRRFIVEQMDLLLAPRSEHAFGPHVRYAKYERRNRAVFTLSQHFPGVGFTDHSYRQKSELDNLREWAGHKVHWIIPVLGGMPIRVFNCLLTGGVPLVPSFYRQMPEVLALGDHALYYDVLDLCEPAALHAAAVAKFDAQGVEGIAARVGAALGHAHIDTRCETVLAAVESELARIAAGRHDRGEAYLPARVAPCIAA